MGMKRRVSFEAWVVFFLFIYSGNLALALDFLARMETSGLSPNLKLWTTVLRAASKTRSLPDAQIALASFEHFQRQQPTVQLDIVGYNTLVGLYAKLGDVHGALALLQTMKLNAAKSRKWNTASSAGGELSETTPAVNSIAPTVVTYNAVMNGMKAASDWVGIVRLYRSMVYEKSAGAQPDAYIYGLVMLAQCELGRWDDALYTHDEMRSAGVLPNDVTYGLVLGACARLADVKRACSLLREMSTVAGLSPGVRHYTAAISACRPSGDWRVAKSLFEEFLLQQQTVVIAACNESDSKANEVLSPSVQQATTQRQEVQIKASGSKDVIKSSKSARAQQRRPSSAGPNVIMFTAAISTCIKFAELRWANELLRDMTRRGVLPNRYTYNCLLRVCAEDAKRSGDLTTTLAVYREMTSPLPSFPGEVLAATAVVGEGREVVSSPHEGRPAYSPDAFTFGALFTACHRTGNATQAEHFMFDAMPLAKVAPLEQHINAALGACAKSSSDNSDDVARFVVRVLQWVDVTSGQALSTGSALYAAAALAAHCQGSSPNEATTALELLRRQEKVAGGVVFTQRFYALMVQALARSGSIDPAASLLLEAEEKGHRPEESTYVEVVTACERSGQWRKAVAIMEDMRRRNYSFYSNPLLDSLFKRLVHTWSSVTKADYDPFTEEQIGPL